MDNKQISFRLARVSKIKEKTIAGSLSRDAVRSLAGGIWTACTYVVLALVLLFAPLATHAQTDTATIVGTVMDQSGAALPNATVTLTNLGTNQKSFVKTDSAGSYVATPLKIGDYSVAVEAQGFKSETRNGVTLSVQDRLRVDFTMQVGATTDRVTVTGAPPLLQTESSALGDVIEGKQVAALPLNGRDYTQIGRAHV